MNSATDLSLILLPNRLAVCSMAVDAPDPDWTQPGDLLAFIHTRDEFTIVCEERFVPPEVKAERGWRAFRVQGTLDFLMVGVLASISAPLAQAGVGIFSVSTFETDYILVKESALDMAIQALEGAGFEVLDHDRLLT